MVKYIDMKGFLRFIFIIILLGTIGFFYRDISIRDFNLAWKNFQNIFFPIVPCAKPIPYKLGTFDYKFNISQAYFLEALKEAEAIWEKPSGKDLFPYQAEKDSNILKINLIYDYRQEATSKLAELGIVVKDTEASYNSLKTKFENLKQEYSVKKEIFEKALADFNARNKYYEKQVVFWNAKGGAPQKEYNELGQTRLLLERETKELQNMQNVLNNMVVEINSMVVVLNRMANNLNINVDTYNTIGASRGESFEEGVYHRDENGEGIDIYEFSNKTKLVRVLAHELGHALGIEHVEDSKAIMYRLNQANALALTQADIDALNVICGASK